MIDNIKFSVTVDDISERVQEIQDSLSDIKITTDNATGEIDFIRGYYQGLKIVLSSYRLTAEGSLTRFLTGSNSNNLQSWADIQEAIKKLEDNFCAAEKMQLSKLEFGANFILNHSVDEYLKDMGYLSRFHKEQKKNTLYYKQTTKNKELAFYDKNKEMISRGEPAPFPGANVLRYELRLRGRAVKQFLPNGTVADLKNKSCYNSIAAAWADYVKQITSNNLSVRGLLNFNRTDNVLIGYIVSLHKKYSLPKDALLQYIDNVTDTHNRKRVRDAVENWWEVCSESRGLYQELLLSVKQLAMYL